MVWARSERGLGKNLNWLETLDTKPTEDFSPRITYLDDLMTKVANTGYWLLDIESLVLRSR